MIPRVIHYCWFGNNPIPEEFQNYIQTWRDKCPEYEIRQWDENNFDIQMVDFVREAYECKKWAFVSDYARLWVIYHYGGIYLDTDVELVSSLDILLKYKAFFGFESTYYVDSGLGFGAVKRHPIVKKMMEAYEGIHFYIDGKMNAVTCPRINTDVLVKYGLKKNGKTQDLGNCIVLSPEYMCPYHYTTKKLNITKHTISIHHFNATWMSVDERNDFEELNNYIHYYGNYFGKFIYYMKKGGIKNALHLVRSKVKNGLDEKN